MLLTKSKEQNTCLIYFFSFSSVWSFCLWHCSKPSESKSLLHVFVFFSPPLRMVLLQQWASFMLLYGLHAILYKCIYLAWGETASSCFILTWTLNLSLYIVCIRLNFGLQFPPPVLPWWRLRWLASFPSTAVSPYSCQHSASLSPVWDDLWPQRKSNGG